MEGFLEGGVWSDLHQEVLGKHSPRGGVLKKKPLWLLEAGAPARSAVGAELPATQQPWPLVFAHRH